MKLWFVVIITLMLSSFCSARTWRVEQDGSGDFENIQPAVDAASPRDTVLVGPGRYDQFWHYSSSLNWDVVVGVDVDSLTIIGSDRESVIIGPTELYPLAGARSDEKVLTSIGIATGQDNTWCVIENISFEHTWRGINLYPSGAVRNCTFRGTKDFGVLADRAIRVIITGCESCGSASIGIKIGAYGAGQELAEISNCHVVGSQTGYYITHPNAVVEGCVAMECHTGYGVTGGSAELRWVEAGDCFAGFTATGGGVIASLTGAISHNSRYRDMSVYSGGMIRGNGVVLSGGGEGETIYIDNGFVELHDSHIMPSLAMSVNVPYHSGPDDAVNLSGNYWGTTSADSIAAWIWDSHDDSELFPTTQATVIFEPFSSEPLPAERKSWGGVRALFR